MGIIADELDRSLIPLQSLLRQKLPLIVQMGTLVGVPTGAFSNQPGLMTGLAIVETPLPNNQMKFIYVGFVAVAKAITALSQRKDKLRQPNGLPGNVGRPGTFPHGHAQRPGQLPNLTMNKQLERIGDRLEREIAPFLPFLKSEVSPIVVTHIPAPVHTPQMDMQFEFVLKAMTEIAKAIRKLEDKIG